MEKRLLGFTLIVLTVLSNSFQVKSRYHQKVENVTVYKDGNFRGRLTLHLRPWELNSLGDIGLEIVRAKCSSIHAPTLLLLKGDIRDGVARAVKIRRIDQHSLFQPAYSNLLRCLSRILETNLKKRVQHSVELKKAVLDTYTPNRIQPKGPEEQNERAESKNEDAKSNIEPDISKSLRTYEGKIETGILSLNPTPMTENDQHHKPGFQSITEAPHHKVKTWLLRKRRESGNENSIHEFLTLLGEKKDNPGVELEVAVATGRIQARAKYTTMLEVATKIVIGGGCFGDTDSKRQMGFFKDAMQEILYWVSKDLDAKVAGLAQQFLTTGKILADLMECNDKATA